MAQFTLQNVGTLDFPRAANGHWRFPLKFSGGDVTFDVNVEGREMTEILFEKVKFFVAEVDHFDSIARSAIRTDFAEDSEGSSHLYLRHHANELSDEEWAQHFGSRDAKSRGVDQLLMAIHLKRIGLYPGSDDYVAVFDYTIDEDPPDYVLAVEFDESGTVFGISMES